eukprot:m.67446 g.67446  ORF g.67446 m.67446 type:complete len:1024 (+) comp8441_c0_seq2:104-3175(+)
MTRATSMALAMMLLPACTLGQNIAYNKTVRVSSTLSPYEGRYAVDGIIARLSRWISDPASPTNIPYLVVDLGDVYFINEVNIFSGIGDGGTAWGLCDHTVDIYTQIATDIDSIGPLNATTNWQNLFSGSYGTLFQHQGSAVVRFIRIMANQGSVCADGTSNRARIVDFQVMGELADSGATLGGVTITNQAQGKNVMASREDTAASLAVDGNLATFWTANANSAWLLVDLAQDMTVFRFSLQGFQASRNDAVGMCWHNISMYNGTASTNTAVSQDTDPNNWIVLSRIISPTVLSFEHDDIRPVRGRFFMMSMNNAPCRNTATRISSFEIYGTTQTNIVGVNTALQNVALNKFAIADSVLTNTAGTYYPANAVDGVTDINSASRWISTDASPVHWLAIDLGANYLVSSISISPDDTNVGGRGVCQYDLQVWSGVSNANLPAAARANCGWTTVDSQTSLSFITQNHNFPPIVGRFVRLVVNQSACPQTDNYARIFEVQIYGVEESNSILPDGTNTSLAGSAGLVPNVALGKRAIADSNLSADYVPSKAFDGDNTSRLSRWVSSGASAQHWLAVDLNSTYLVQGVNLVTGYNGNDGLCSHNISVYTGLYSTLEEAVGDGNHWVIVLSHLAQVIQIEHSGVTPPTYGRFVMLTVDQSVCGWSNHARVYELAVYATPAPPGTTPAAIPNAALGKSGLASTWLNEGPGYPPNNAFDGIVSSNSRWVSNRTGDDTPWLAVDLEDQYTIFGASMVVGWPGSLCLTGLCSYNISVWSGSSSMSLAQATASTTGWTDLIVNDQYTHSEATHDEFPPNSMGQYVRLSIDQTNCGNFSGVYARQVLDGIVRIMEFRVFGLPVTMSPTTSPTALPTMPPTTSPTWMPTVAPTVSPTAVPTTAPTMAPTARPTVSPTRVPTTQAPTTQAPVVSSSSSGTAGNLDQDLLIIVVIIAIVVLVVVGAVIYKTKSGGGGRGGGASSMDGGVAFDNPMYDDSSKQVATSADVDGEYMDINTDTGATNTDGYMDAEPDDEDGFD